MAKEKLSKVIAKLEKYQIMRKRPGKRWQRCCVETFIEEFSEWRYLKNLKKHVDAMTEGGILEDASGNDYRLRKITKK
jgi:hypothetical protein